MMDDNTSDNILVEPMQLDDVVMIKHVELHSVPIDDYGKLNLDDDKRCSNQTR